MTRIAAYCRISTDKEEQLDSLANQKKFFFDFAQRNRFELVGLYADEGISGKSIQNRTQFQRMIRDAEAHRFDLVVVKDISRFARNAVDFLNSIRKLKTIGIPCRFITANLGTEDGELVLGMLALVAQEESANLSKRVKFGKHISAQKGRVPNKVFGYDRIDTYTLRINEREAETVRLMFLLYTERGYGLRKLCSELMRRGLPSKEGSVWYPRTVSRMLTNSLYCGLYRNNKWEITDFMEGRRRRKPEEAQFLHDRPDWAIVDRETFARAQERLRWRREPVHSAGTSGAARYSSRHLFSNLIRCETCGAGYIRKHYAYRTERVYWKCRRHDQQASACRNAMTVEEAELTAFLWETLCGLFDPSDLEQAVRKRYAAARARTDVSGTLSAERNRLLRLEAKYRAMYLDDLIDLAELKRNAEGIRLRLEELSAAPPCGTDRTQPENAARPAGQIVREVLRLERMTNAELRCLLDRIEVTETGTATVFFGGVCDIAR